MKTSRGRVALVATHHRYTQSASYRFICKSSRKPVRTSKACCSVHSQTQSRRWLSTRTSCGPRYQDTSTTAKTVPLPLFPSPVKTPRNDVPFDKNKRKELVTQNMARALLEDDNTTWDTAKHKRAKKTLIQLGPLSGVESVNLSIRLIQKMVQEMKKNDKIGNEKESQLLKNPKYLAPIFSKYRKTAITMTAKTTMEEGEDDLTTSLIPPRQLLLQLIAMKEQSPEYFDYDSNIVGLILDTAIQQANSPRDAWKVAIDFWKIIQDSKHVRPERRIYGRILQALATSGSPEAPKHVEAFYTQMKRNNYQPNNVIYTILFRFWGARGNTNKVEEILRSIPNPSLATLTQAVYVFSRSISTLKTAEKILQQMIDMEEVPNKELPDKKEHFIGESAQYLLLAYRNIVTSNADAYSKEYAVERATDLWKKISHKDIVKGSGLDALVATYMNILAYGGRHEQAEAFSKKQQLTREQYTILMKSYAKNGMASRAPSIIDVMLETEHAKPDTFSFNVAINALAESPRKDAFEKAYALFRRMEDDPLCAELGIQPDSWTYTALLKCLASKARFMEGYVTTAEEIFHEMQCRCQAGDKNIMINDVAYTLMIKIYLRAGESKKAEEVINNLKSPSERVYTDIIAYWAKEGTIEAAQQAVALLLRMKNRAKAGMANVQPSLWTYSLVIGAFANCKDPEAAKRVWSLVEDMKLEDVEMNSVIYTQLISYFCSSPAERHLLVKADLLLKQMEESKNPNLRPDYRHFSIVKKGWLEIGDIDEAEDILLRWIESTVQANHQTGTVKLVHIESIIMAWVQAGDLVRATRLLFQLDEMSCLRKIKEGPGLSIHTTLLQNWEDSLNQKKHKYIPRLKLKIADLQSISQRQNEIDEQIDRLGLNHFKRLNGS